MQDIIDLDAVVVQQLPGETKIKLDKSHHCPDWDFDFINESDPEFESCTCFSQLSVENNNGDI